MYEAGCMGWKRNYLSEINNKMDCREQTKDKEVGADCKPWYKNGLRFECQRCGKCCRGEPGVVWVNGKEIKDISRFLGMTEEMFAKKYLRNIYGRISLVEYGNGDCVMYNNGCVIYEVRPCQCRTFPFWSSNIKEKNEWEKLKGQCQGIDKGRLHNLKTIRKNLIVYENRFAG